MDRDALLLLGLFAAFAIPMVDHLIRTMSWAEEVEADAGPTGGCLSLAFLITCDFGWLVGTLVLWRDFEEGTTAGWLMGSLIGLYWSFRFLGRLRTVVEGGGRWVDGFWLLAFLWLSVMYSRCFFFATGEAGPLQYVVVLPFLLLTSAGVVALLGLAWYRLRAWEPHWTYVPVSLFVTLLAALVVLFLRHHDSVLPHYYRWLGVHSIPCGFALVPAVLASCASTWALCALGARLARQLRRCP